jgi:opacity protein-like surface antigen
MRPILLGLAAATLAGHAAAQGRARIGPTLSAIAIEDGAGATHTYYSVGGSFGFIAGDDGEIGVTVARYKDLSSDACTRALTFYSVDSYYYPVGPKGIAPFAVTEVGLARVTESSPPYACGLLATTATTTEIGLGYGLGLRVNVGDGVSALIEGRFFQVPNSQIQALEGRANLSVAFGKPRRSELLNGTVGPALGLLFPLSGPMEGRGPTLGVRFRRDTKKRGTVSLQVDYASLRAPADCPTKCEPNAILFAPGYEASLHLPWGRFYGELGPLLAGFPSQTADRGVSQGVQGGLGADILSGQSLMWNVNGRVLWFQRNSGGNVFLLQMGVSLSPRVGH